MRIILTRDSTDALPLTYERIYALCRDAVVIHDQGETLAGMLSIELDQSVTRLERALADDISEGVGFALPLVQALTWLEKQVGLLEDVMTYLDRGYLAQKKEGHGIQFVS
jgi:cullin-4